MAELHVVAVSPVDRLAAWMVGQGMDPNEAPRQARYAIDGIAALCGLLEDDHAETEKDDRRAA